jgi:hypothetical protein
MRLNLCLSKFRSNLKNQNLSKKFRSLMLSYWLLILWLKSTWVSGLHSGHGNSKWVRGILAWRYGLVLTRLTMGRIFIRLASADVKNSKKLVKLPWLRNLIRIWNFSYIWRPRMILYNVIHSMVMNSIWSRFWR